MSSSSLGRLLASVVAVSATGCGSQHEDQTPASTQPDGPIEVALIVPRPADLPTCNASIGGTVAYVTSSSALYACVNKQWQPIACNENKAGTVAYASDPETLFACLRNKWSQVQLPQGPVGPAGEPGAQGPVGPQGEPGAAGEDGAHALLSMVPIAAGEDCEYGGVQLFAGLDSDRDGVLDQAEVTQVSFVCNGDPGSSGSGECMAATIGCDGQQPRFCDANGEWKAVGSPCSNACVDGACVGVCAPGSSYCDYWSYYGGSANNCNAFGQWESEACGYACTQTVGDDQQVHAACIDCYPSEASCDGQTPRTCDASGHWTSGETCVEQTCYYGSCVGECQAGETRCTGAAFEVCDYYGQWVQQQTCAGLAQGQCEESVCNAELGCLVQLKAQGTACDDGNACTGEDACDELGACGGSVVPDGTSCSDGDPCTGGETCSEGACGTPSSTISVCTTGDLCCPEGCVGADGDCAPVCVPGDYYCGYDVGYTANNCNQYGQWETERCGAYCTYEFGEDQQVRAACMECWPGEGLCDGQTPRLCDETGHWAVGADCADQTCYFGSCLGECVAGETRCTGDTFEICDSYGQWLVQQTCSDVNTSQCQQGVCDAELGCLLQPQAGAACDDGNACTVADVCSAEGTCAGANADDGTACSDGDACTQGEACVAGVCGQPQSTVNECTTGDQCCPAGCADQDGDCIYWQSGVQQNVAPEAMAGWSACYAGNYGSYDSLETILGQCNKAKLLLACRPAGAASFSLVAMAPREDVLFDCGSDEFCSHAANGVAWYYSNEWSWGFAPEGTGVHRITCDYNGYYPKPDSELRMCWHTGSNALSSGYRCGNDVSGSSDYERWIFQAD